MKISISKQQLAALPMAHFSGRIEVVDTSTAADRAVEELRKADLIGFDTETRPSFKKGQSHDVALLQLSTTECSYLFRLNIIGLPDSLRELLEDPAKTKIGLSTHDDFRNLRKIHEALAPEGFIELQEFVTQWSIIDKSLTKLYGILFGQRLSKSQRLSNWEAEELGEAQQHYAALDALACIQIYTYLLNGNFHPENSQYIVTSEATEL